MESREDRPRRRLFSQPHRRRSLRPWVVPLLLVVAVMVLLPRLVAFLEG